MQTPKHYISQLKAKNLSEELIGDVLYSLSKRAKNCRDQKRKYEHALYYRYAESTANKYAEKMDYYYELKDNILNKSIFEPKEVHVVKYNSNFTGQ